MSAKYWSGEWPNLNSVSIAIDVSAGHLTAAELGALYRLAWFIAVQSVNTAYSVAIDAPKIPNKSTVLARVAGCSPAEWNKLRHRVLEYFTLKDGAWHLTDESIIKLSREAVRSPLPAITRAAILRRDGRRCVYCGDEEGPFHYDHLWPVSKGGTDDPNNIVLACSNCNLSKGGKTLLEWRGGQ